MIPPEDASSIGPSALKINEGVDQPSCVNPDALRIARRQRKRTLSADEFVKGILDQNRVILSKAITLIESTKTSDQQLGQEVIEKCLPHSGRSIRIGITGVPGVGKSTFIEALGLHVLSLGHKLAVLAIDPSSTRSGGSILGDKTRMTQLSTHPDVFIRPSPSAGTLGGVARKTRETIILCEAAGFDVIFIETVGVGQSETTVHSMVDFFLLLMLAGAGDELQGIKRGIMEMADAIFINKADGDNRVKALQARLEYQNALQLFPVTESGWKPVVDICSAITGEGIPEVWKTISEYREFTRVNGYFLQKRKQQKIHIMSEMIRESLLNDFYSCQNVIAILPDMESSVLDDKISPYNAAQKLLEIYFSQRSNSK